MPPRAEMRGEPRHSSSKGETREESQSMWSPFSQSGATVAAGEECDDGCSVSKLESKTCTTVVEGPDGNPVRKCEVVRRLLRRCPGKPVEEVESTREETTESLGSGHADLASSSPDFAQLQESMERFNTLFEDFAGVLGGDRRGRFFAGDDFGGFAFPPRFHDGGGSGRGREGGVNPGEFQET